MLGGIGDAIKSVGQAIGGTIRGAAQAVADVLPGAAKVTAAYLTAERAAQAVITGEGTVQVTEGGQTFTVGKPIGEPGWRGFSPLILAGIGVAVYFLLFRKRGR